MAREEELFTIDSEGEAGQFVCHSEELSGLFSSEADGEVAVVEEQPTNNVRKVSGRNGAVSSSRGEVDDLPDVSAPECGLRTMGFDASEFKLANSSLFEKIRNLDDNELESVASLELWNLYKEMGPSIWPSFLRYENPPKNVKVFGSRFYLSEKPEKMGQGEVVFASIKDGKGVHDKEDGLHGNYLLQINQVLKELSERRGFYSMVFNNEENARKGLINLYLVTNGIKKSLSSGKCQFCGSSRCNRRAKSCKANRCFRCLLKGHQIKDCDTKYGFFNQKLLFPIRMERESLFSERSTLENLFRNSKRSFDAQAFPSKVCICLNCNQTGHINCSKQAPMLSKESDVREVVSSSDSRFLIFPDDPASPVQGNRGAYNKSSTILPPSNKLFNISYLLEFTKNMLLDQDSKAANARQKSPAATTRSRGGFKQTNTNTHHYPQTHTRFQHPGQFNIHNHTSTQAQTPDSYSLGGYGAHHYQHLQNGQPSQTHDPHQNHVHRYPARLQSQPCYHHSRPVSHQITTYWTPDQNNAVYHRHATQTVVNSNDSLSRKRVFSSRISSRSRNG